MIFFVNTIVVAINKTKLSKRIPLALPINIFPLKDFNYFIYIVSRFDKITHLFCHIMSRMAQLKYNYLFCTKKLNLVSLLFELSKEVGSQ